VEKEMDSIQVDWPKFAEEFHRRESDAVYKAMLMHGLVQQNFKRGDLKAAFARQENWFHAFEVRGRAVLFAYSLFVWGMQEWELSIDHEMVEEGLRGAKDALEIAKGQSDDIRAHVDLPVVELIVSLADALKLCMKVEDTLYNSCLPAFSEYSQGLVTVHEQIEESLGLIDGVEEAVRDCLSEIIQTQLQFYTALTDFGEVTFEDHLNGVGDVGSLEKTIQKLDTAEIELTKPYPDVLSSDLLPYQRILKTLLNRSRSLEKDLSAIKFEDVKIIYIFPFTIDDLSGRDIYEKTVNKLSRKKTNCDDQLESSVNELQMLDGVRPRLVREAELTDLWQWRGFRPPLKVGAENPVDVENPEYGAADIEMPDLTVTPQAGRPISDYRVKVRITTLGNHYVRIEKDLKNPVLEEINQGLRRASSLMIEPKITCEDTESSKSWPNLTEYAKSIARGLYNLDNSDCSGTPKRREDEVLSDITARFHVVCEIRSARAGSENGGRQEATEEQIKDFAAPLLLQPLTRLAIAPEEWVCYRTSEWDNILKQDSFEVDFAVGTSNTTIISMPASPDWFYNSYEECIELVVSFPSLVRQWTHEIRNKHELTRATMVPPEAQDDSTTFEFAGGEIVSREAQEDPKRFAEVRRDLHDTIIAIRKRRTFLTPSELVGSGHHRAFVENLFDIARISDLLKDLDAQLQIAELVHDRAVEYQRRLSDDQRDVRESEFGKTTSVLLILIGSFAFAGVAEMFDHQWFGERYHIFESSSSIPLLNMFLWIASWVFLLYLALRYIVGTKLSIGAALRSASKKLGLNRWNRPRQEAQTAERSGSV
jgi:hypothetical protein